MTEKFELATNIKLDISKLFLVSILVKNNFSSIVNQNICTLFTTKIILLDSIEIEEYLKILTNPI